DSQSARSWSRRRQMVRRNWVMLCVVCRSLQHCHSRVVAPGRAATTQQAFAFTSSLLAQGRRIGGKTPSYSTKNSVLLPPADARQIGGNRSAVLAKRISAGRGMFSSSALEGRRRGGGRGRGGGRRSPDYGPPRAGQRR
ncbi:unnamed protein product, partial [Ectocarpus fasciculatus]